MFFKFKLLNIFKNICLLVLLQKVLSFMKTISFKCIIYFNHVHHPQCFPFSLLSLFFSCQCPAPSFPLLSCLLHKNIIHTQTHVHTCAHTHTLRNMCVLSSVCLSVLSVYASIKRHFGPQMRQSVFVLLCLAYVIQYDLCFFVSDIIFLNE